MKNVFYINLDERTDRKKYCEEILDELGWEYSRFPAIKKVNGAYGCMLSHERLLEKAIEEDLEYIIIFEDDILIEDIDKFKTEVNKFVNIDIGHLVDPNLKSTGAHLIKFGANTFPPYKEIYDDYVNLNYSLCTHAYFVKKENYNIILNNIKECIFLYNKAGNNTCNGIFTIDNWQNILIHKFNKKIIAVSDTKKDKLYITQKGDFSNIENNYTDYSEFVKSLKIGKQYENKLQIHNNIIASNVKILLNEYEKYQTELQNLHSN